MGPQPYQVPVFFEVNEAHFPGAPVAPGAEIASRLVLAGTDSDSTEHLVVQANVHFKRPIVPPVEHIIKVRVVTLTPKVYRFQADIEGKVEGGFTLRQGRRMVAPGPLKRKELCSCDEWSGVNQLAQQEPFRLISGYNPAYRLARWALPQQYACHQPMILFEGFAQAAEMFFLSKSRDFDDKLPVFVGFSGKVCWNLPADLFLWVSQVSWDESDRRKSTGTVKCSALTPDGSFGEGKMNFRLLTQEQLSRMHDHRSPKPR